MSVTAYKAIEPLDYVIARKLRVDDTTTFKGALSVVSAPTLPEHIANKEYVDQVARQLDVKLSCKVATTAALGDLDSGNYGIGIGNIVYYPVGGTKKRGLYKATLTIANTFPVDGVTLTTANNGARILIKDQTNAKQNGIYTSTISGTSLILERATDFDDELEVNADAFTFIEEGTVNNNNGFIVQSNDPIIVGGLNGSNIVWVQFTGAGLITAGGGLTKTGNTIDVGGSDTILVNADNVEVKSSNTANQVLLSWGGGQAAQWSALTLADSNSTIGELTVDRGGTGLSTITDHGVMVGSGTDPVTPLTVGTDGQILVGSTGVDPVFATLGSTGGTIGVTGGAGTLSIDIAKVVGTYNTAAGTDAGIVIPNGTLVFELTVGTESAPYVLTGPAGVAGQILLVRNDSSQATTGLVTVAGAGATFAHNGVSWLLIG